MNPSTGTLDIVHYAGCRQWQEGWKRVQNLERVWSCTVYGRPKKTGPEVIVIKLVIVVEIKKFFIIIM